MARSDTVTSDTRKIRIFLIEDNDDHAELVARSLETAWQRLELERAPDGESALRRLFELRDLAVTEPGVLPDLVLLDLRLPKVDGLEVLRRLKEDELLRPVPVVVLSSSDEDGDVTRAYERFANSYVVKPLDFSRLGKLLDELGAYWLDVNRKPRHA